jgi:hypothetical protein
MLLLATISALTPALTTVAFQYGQTLLNNVSRGSPVKPPGHHSTFTRQRYSQPGQGLDTMRDTFSSEQPTKSWRTDSVHKSINADATHELGSVTSIRILIGGRCLARRAARKDRQESGVAANSRGGQKPVLFKETRAPIRNQYSPACCSSLSRSQ